MKDFIAVKNSGAVKLADLPILPFGTFRSELIENLNSGSCRISAFFVQKYSGRDLLTAIAAVPEKGEIRAAAAEIGNSFESLTAEAPAFQAFERELLENNGIVPLNHPNPKPLRNPEMEYFTMSGDAVNEVAVGPVHAGVIEPGHFRFQCVGEKVYSLEIALGYQHRGVERLLCGKLNSRTMPLFETAAGDTAAAAADGAARALEALAQQEVSPYAKALRALAAELERVANHTGDLGALAGDVAYLPTSSFCGRIRGEYLNMTAELCGNRFGRNFICPGGVRFDVEAARAERLQKHLAKVNPELYHALDLLFDSPTVLDRFENTGTVDRETAAALGLVGVAARASGLDMDIRRQLPYGYYRDAAVGSVPTGSGDVLSRAKVRYDEIKNSLEYIDKLLASLGSEKTTPAAAAEFVLQPEAMAVSLTEAWRGELCQVIITDKDGGISQCRIVDPSFHNWQGLAMALRGEQISNFPICNKSFNLSYCGHDL